VKQAVLHEVGKIFRNDGTVNIRDFIFQNQVRTGYKDPEHLPPAARVAANMQLEISRGQRVAYLVVHKGLEAQLSDQVVPPDEVVTGKSMIDCGYYVFRQIIPALQRTLGIVLGSAIPRWVREIPQRKKAVTTGSLDNFISRNRCRRCDARATLPNHNPTFCKNCLLKYPEDCQLVLVKALQTSEAQSSSLRKICMSCAKGPAVAEACKDAWHCSVYFERQRVQHQLHTARDDYLCCSTSGYEW